MWQWLKLLNSIEDVGWHHSCNLAGDREVTQFQHWLVCTRRSVFSRPGMLWIDNKIICCSRPLIINRVATNKNLLNNFGFLKMQNSSVISWALDHLQTSIIYVELDIERISSQTWKSFLNKLGQIMLYPRDWWSAKIWSVTFI